MEKTFEYTVIHRSTGKRFQEICRCESKLLFLMWINTWNHNPGDWLYLAPITTNGNEFHPTDIEEIESQTT